MQALGIVMLSVVAAVAYGIAHDQVTARVCVEYFTIGHPRVIASEDPTLLAFAWGVLATWWVGLGLGLLLAAAARLGSWPRLDARSLLRSLVSLLVVMGLGSIVAGFLGHALARQGTYVLLEPLASRIAPERHALFLADLWAHNAAYLLGGLGGLVLALLVVLRRRRAAVARTASGQA